MEDRPMIAWIFENEEYTELYHEYLAQFIDEYFNGGYFETMIDDVVSMISPYVEKDPTKFCSYEEFQTGVETLKEFCLYQHFRLPQYSYPIQHLHHPAALQHQYSDHCVRKHSSFPYH